MVHGRSTANAKLSESKTSSRGSQWSLKYCKKYNRWIDFRLSHIMTNKEESEKPITENKNARSLGRSLPYFMCISVIPSNVRRRSRHIVHQL
eukprot:scaffold4760_cov168-Skeletonema_marinoi.AAC.1